MLSNVYSPKNTSGKCKHVVLHSFREAFSLKRTAQHWSQVNDVSDECSLKWTGLHWTRSVIHWSQTKRYYTNVVSNEQVSNESVLKW